MIPANQLQLDFIQQAHHTGSEANQELSLAQRDYYINKAKNYLYELYAGHVENNDLLRQYLRPLIVRGEKLNGKVSGDKYEVTYPGSFYKLLKISTALKKGKCPSRDIIIRRPSSDKIDRARKNPNISRVWDFEETIGIENKEGFEFYHAGLGVEKVELDYLKKLPDVASPEYENSETYITSDGTPVTVNADLQIDDPAFAQKIVAAAVLFAARDYGNIPDFESRLATIANIERVF